MAVPTFTACSPSTVFTGGQLVTITGANFQLPYPLPDSNGPIPDPPPTVAVLFGGVPARKVRVLSSSSLTCVAPAHEPGAVAVAIQNLDDEGDPIVGEAVTAAAAVTYARADLSVADDLDRVTEELVKLLRREVISEVVLTEATDYTDDAGRLQFNITKFAAVPCVTLMGPSLRDNKFFGEASPEEQRGTNYVRRRNLKTSDLVFKVSVIDNSNRRAIRLAALLTKVLKANAYFYVDRDSADLSKGQVRFDLEADDLASVGSPSDSDIRVYTGAITIKGFNFEDVAGFPDSMVADKGAVVDNIETTVASKSVES